MKERPILFSGPMVRAILEGRKTQTRRVVKHKQPLFEAPHSFKAYQTTEGVFGFESYDETVRCPYGQPGDRLWVRETWAYSHQCEHYNHLHERNDSFIYRATNEACGPKKWRPPIHMPRWASRITLEVTGVRVERVLDISEEDARDEGPPDIFNDTWPTIAEYHPIDAFRTLWNSINGNKPGRSWDDNPWVWVIEFKRIDTTTA